MTSETPQPPIETDSPASASERNVLLITYVLYGLSCFFFLTAIAGVIVNHIKLGDVPRGGVAWSHHRWQMRTFWFTIFWSVVCLILTPFLIGVLGYLVLWLWCAYRFIRGIAVFADGRAMPV
ncbi:membrane protein [Salinisphaera japonica YTM-1]|uniref:Membrane protein n=2 Tax=Salinisphaera TaxID=180541 RepID=A0A423Q0L4_9GAMM|nr:membrane protein [Salinisphaera japonica YTM-1]